MSSIREGRRRPLPYAGLLLSASSAVILMGIITAEALYPAPYSTAANEISDLGATRPPDSVILQPSAAIFDGTMLLAGALILTAAYLLHRSRLRRSVTVGLAVLGAGVFGVGMFPGNTAPHPLIALVTFVSGGVVALLASRTQAAPARYVSQALGGATLLSIVLGYFLLDWGPVAELGDGGIERWIAYPVVLWLAVFGGYAMGRPAADAGRPVTSAAEQPAGR